MFVYKHTETTEYVKKQPNKFNGYSSRICRIKNAKFSGQDFYKNTNIRLSNRHQCTFNPVVLLPYLSIYLPAALPHKQQHYGKQRTGKGFLTDCDNKIFQNFPNTCNHDNNDNAVLIKIISNYWKISIILQKRKVQHQWLIPSINMF